MIPILLSFPVPVELLLRLLLLLVRFRNSARLENLCTPVLGTGNETYAVQRQKTTYSLKSSHQKDLSPGLAMASGSASGKASDATMASGLAMPTALGSGTQNPPRLRASIIAYYGHSQPNN
uniref:Uncharacterized protein n=1 Tax=Oryza brachyantha TaxID=4533 RepID=J3L4X0_ORYBR